MWKNRVIYLIALAGAILFFIEYHSWISLYVLAIVVVGPLFSLLIGLPSMRNLYLEMQTPHEVAQGARAEVRFVLKKSGKDGRMAELIRGESAACLLVFERREPRTGKRQRRKVRVPAGGKVRFALPTEHCTVFHLNAVSVRVYDPLGIFSLQVKRTESAEVLVAPEKREPSPRPDFSAFRTTPVRPKAGGGFSEQYELREYRPGDSMRDVHWKLSAKTDRMIVREAQEPVPRNIVVTVDPVRNPEENDCLTGILFWVMDELSQRGQRFRVVFSTGAKVQIASVEKETDVMRALTAVLSARPGDGAYSAAHAGAGADWSWHVSQ